MSAFTSACSISNTHSSFFQSLVTKPITPKKRGQHVSSFSICSCYETKNKSTVSRRRLLLNVPFLLWDPFFMAIGAEVLKLEKYTDLKEGFTLLIPSSWNKVDKAGATVLFQDPSKGSNNVGVVVSPVRITTLSQFGTPQFVADKLILAEKRKESTKEAEVVAVSERTGEEGLQVYEFEYKVDSTRGGMKRIFSAAFVVSRKLYLLNIAHSDAFESPIDPDRRNTLEQILHSFDTAPTT